MEHKVETNCLVKHKKRKKKEILQNSKPNQVTSKISDNNKIELDMMKQHLKIGSCSSSNESIAISRSNITKVLGIDNNNQNREYSSSSNSESPRHLKQNESSSVNMLPFYDISSDQNPNLNEISNSCLEKNHRENIIVPGKLIQFENCEKKGFVSCRYCHRIFCYDIPVLTDHATHCKQLHERPLKNIFKYNCLICNKVFRKLKDWKSHTINNFHLQKCMIQNNYVSYVCGGCKAVFFGNKGQILNHCKDIHKDVSGLPCIYKCMKDVFDHFIFVDRKNLKSWTFCAPCKRYSSSKVNCNHQNHRNRITNHFKCNSCLVDFICSQEVYNYHLLSCEHIMLDCLRTESNPKLESQTACHLKLPPIFLNKFSIDNEKATCNDCKFQMFPNEKAITVHLADECIYKSNKGRKKSAKIKMFFCAVCHKTISDFGQWKLHLISSSHLIKCYDKSDLVSYTCQLCSLHCYGDSFHVSEHQNIHPNNSEKKLSMFLAFNFQRINNDLNCKYFYFCEDCETYDEDSNLNHWNKSHQTKLKRIACQPCKTEFYCIEANELFTKHELSSEHIILKYVAIKNRPSEPLTLPLSKSKKNTVLQYEEQTLCSFKSSLEIIKNQAPLYFKPYLNWFKFFEDKNKADCKECNDSIDISENSLLNHLLDCGQDSPINISKTYINYFRCLECHFYSNDYGLWEKHAISHINAEISIMQSYFCISCSTLLYGKINDIELHLNNEHKTTTISMPLDSQLMAKQFLRKNNACKTYDIFCFCEPCKKIFKAIDNSNHFNTDSHASVASDLVELFYCKYCEVEFYSSITVYERHKLTAEHIMMSLECSSYDIKDVLHPYQLYAHLFKFVTNQKLYDATQNIGYFCFVCDYLCTTLYSWKIHITGKNHIKSSKSLCMDHRCKICKTLMFGQRKHMFEHYSNRFHSMLRIFKSLPHDDSLLPTTFETKSICSTETTSENVQETENGNNKHEESYDENNLLSKMMNELSLKQPKININETYSTVKTVDKNSLVSNIQHDTTVKEESTTNISKTYSMIKMLDESLLGSNTEQDCSKFGESNSNTNEELYLDKLPLKINTEQDGCTFDKSNTSMNGLHSIDKCPLKTNTNNYCNFYDLVIKNLCEMLNLNKKITLQSVYNCLSCDFITSIKNLWDEHILKSHSNNMDGIKRVFCDTCNLNQIGPSDNLDEHNSTVEHLKMLKFKKLCSSNNVKKTKEIEENKDNSKSSNDAKTSVTDKEVKNDEKEMSNRKFMIEIKGVKPKYKKNGWAELKKTFAPYGFFGLYPKPNSVVIIFRKVYSAHDVIKNKEKLENAHEFTISAFIEEERLPELNKTTEYEFGNKEILIKTINTQLEAINNEISNPEIFHRLHLLINAVHRCSGQCFLGSKTYAFGSRMSGLALKESDVDLYFDIANTFGGQLSNDLNAQEDLVRYFGKVFRSQSIEFKNIQLITAARVPIVKFVHIPSGLNCDLSFKSGLSTHNTKLVRLYLTLDKRVHWIVCAVVKRWALQNDLKNQSMFTSYALAWLVLFYLMTIDVVPPLELLRKHATPENGSDVIFIEDWDCTFCTLEKAKQIWKVPAIPDWDLLFGFFNFYSDFNRLKQFVLCPAIGKYLPKEVFYKVPMNKPDIMGFYKKRIGRPSEWSMRLKDHFYGEGLAVQDPFDLFHNITKTIGPKKLQVFSHLCTKTMEVMNNNKGIFQPYYA